MKVRILHTTIRVGDIDCSINFYTRVLGMTPLRKNDYPDGRFTLAFVGYGNEADSAVTELTHNWDANAYEIGTGYNHIAAKVDDAYQVCDDIRNNGGQATREAGPMKHDTAMIVFVTSPDDYEVGLTQKSS